MKTVKRHLSIALICLHIFMGCATYNAQEVGPIPIMQAEQEIPEDQLLDVGILVFESKEIDEETAKKEGTHPDIRKAESHFIPYHLKNTLNQSSHWGAVRVLPAETSSVDLLVSGEILESNGEHLVLKVVYIEMAMKTYDELAFLYPESDTLLDAAKERGEIYSSLGKHWKAVEEYEWLLTRTAIKERGGYQYLIAMEYFKMNDFKQARIEFAEIKDNNNESGLLPEIHFRIATSYYLEKNLTDSLTAYKEVVKKFPENKLAFQSSINIAQIYSDADRLTEAVDLLQRLKLKSDKMENELIDIRIALIKERIKNPTRRTKRKKR